MHILFLIGFRNRIIVMIQWAWSYLTFQRGARLITDESRVGAVPTLEYAERAQSSSQEREQAPIRKQSA